MAFVQVTELFSYVGFIVFNCLKPLWLNVLNHYKTWESYSILKGSHKYKIINFVHTKVTFLFFNRKWKNVYPAKIQCDQW